MHSRQRPKAPRVHRGLSWLKDSAATMGAAVISGKGSGKSTLLGLEWAWRWWLTGYGGLFQDPGGAGIDRFLQRVLLYSRQKRLSPQAFQRLLSRIRYVDFSCQQGTAVGWPLIRQYQGQDLYQAAQPFLSIVKRLDSKLTDAPIQGWNPLSEIYENAAIILAALAAEGLQITEVEGLLRGAKNENTTWTKRFAQAVERYPEAAPAVRYFQTQYATMNGADRKRLSGSLLTKLRLFSLSPSTRAMFGQSQPGISWPEVIDQGIIVLGDFRDVSDEDKPFLELMLLRDYVGFFEHRGPGKQHKKAFLIVDELTDMTDQMGPTGEGFFARDLNKLINRTARNCNLMAVLCLQEAWQVSDEIFASLRSCANVVQGVSSHLDSAIKVARELFPYDAQIIKAYQPVYGGHPPEVIDYRGIPYSPQEWDYFVAQAVQQLKAFKFLVRGSAREGEFNGPVEAMSIEHLIPLLPMDSDAVAWLREKLARRDGVPISTVLAEIECRQSGITPSVKQQMKSGLRSAIVKADEQRPADDAATDLPPATGADDDFWQER